MFRVVTMLFLAIICYMWFVLNSVCNVCSLMGFVTLLLINKETYEECFILCKVYYYYKTC